MQIIELTKEQFDKFAFNHKNHNFYQTSQYGALMNRHGYIDIYVGLLDDGNNLIGATLILSYKKLGNFKVGYAPRGFLIDFNDFNLVATFTKLLKNYLFRLGYIYITIDPYVIHVERDIKGNPIPSGVNNGNLIELLGKLNYIHFGFNLNFETAKPRWNIVTKLNNSSTQTFSSFNKETRNKIRKSYKRGVTIYKGNRNDLKLFYSLVGKKHSRKLNYYFDYYEIFSKNDMFDIYFAKLDPAVYMKTSKDLYENELKYNSEITNLVQKNTKSKKKNKYISLKMSSDRLLSVYKNDVVNANNLFKAYPNEVVIATSAVIKYNKEAFFLIDGYNEKFKSFSANHLIKWAVINEFTKKGYSSVHHNGITGNFDKSDPLYGLYEFKKGFNVEVVEYIGEFNLIINKQTYNTYLRLSSLKNIFNTKNKHS
ncbi:MAG: peptidoglycan bridge formation glycyltransferase FemA/FemB family protein [Bacilli bacterium]|nr:peptidoglycan bridge formation glycyltransferase FemA/FemB family protein [Bacilli bacterium]MDD3304691.1 peptidoglycan bridge formation glycyltransferase FemA/FemB family protein [Bacilli bacterium]MDD4053257.1 peptidoglycan bridge formation glycyltransferase FemA/FemB family protein [Bacilli bacterium]MDD4411219.1 peptidoglycan bridge formation glycyltransferase FemA/FemB family protein [Bacilli bacterium]